MKTNNLLNGTEVWYKIQSNTYAVLMHYRKHRLAKQKLEVVALAAAVFTDCKLPRQLERRLRQLFAWCLVKNPDSLWWPVHRYHQHSQHDCVTFQQQKRYNTSDGPCLAMPYGGMASAGPMYPPQRWGLISVGPMCWSHWQGKSWGSSVAQLVWR